MATENTPEQAPLPHPDQQAAAVAPKTPLPTQELIAVDSLDFDPENPRFLDAIGTTDGEASAIRRMIEEENLDELVGSIGNQGFFPGEPLLVAPNPKSPGRYLVVEGNRRLAALRVLNGKMPQNVLTTSLARLVENAQHKPKEVDCFKFTERREILKYLGFRHISGPRRWEPLSKARYLADLIRNFYQNLEPEDQLKAVAKDIGSRRDYVAQLLTTLNLYDRAKGKNFYGLQRVQEQDISFSLLSTALSYTNIVQHLNLAGRDVVNVDNINDDNAKELFSWMFAQNDEGETVLVESRHLKKLAAVLGSPQATIELRNSRNLDKAYLFSDGPGEAFLKLLSDADSNLSSCVNMLSDGELVFDEGHAKLVERVLSRAESLELLMQKAARRHARSQSNEKDL